MSRPKSGAAYELLAVRVPQGTVERLTLKARLAGMAFPEYVRKAIDAYETGTPLGTLDTEARQALVLTRRELQAQVKNISEVLRLTPSASVKRSSAPAPVAIPDANDEASDSTQVEEPALPLPTLVQGEPETAPFPDSDSAPTLALPSGHTLGSLCKNGHDYEGTGQSLRDKKGECRECKRAAGQKRQARYVARTHATTAL